MRHITYKHGHTQAQKCLYHVTAIGGYASSLRWRNNQVSSHLKFGDSLTRQPVLAAHDIIPLKCYQTSAEAIWFTCSLIIYHFDLFHTILCKQYMMQHFTAKSSCCAGGWSAKTVSLLFVLYVHVRGLHAVCANRPMTPQCLPYIILCRILHTFCTLEQC